MMLGLEPFRRRLDRLDEEIARALGERFEVCREIALYKRANDIPMMQPARVEEVRARYLGRGADANMPADFTADLFELLIAATCKMEDELIEAGEEASPAAAEDASLTPAEDASPGRARSTHRRTQPRRPAEGARR
jgi:chorismate mutase